MEKLVYNCMRLTKWIPVIFIAAVIGWSYYAYIVHLCLCNFCLYLTFSFDLIKKYFRSC